MSSAEKADEAKAAGNAAFKAGNYDEAVAQFSAARANVHLCDRSQRRAAVAVTALPEVPTQNRAGASRQVLRLVNARGTGQRNSRPAPVSLVLRF